MLSRRFLRIKALQTLYAFYQAERASYEVALDHFNDLQKTSKNNLLRLFPFDVARLTIDSGTIKPEENLSNQEQEVIEIFINDFKKTRSADVTSLRKQMMKATDNVFNNYLLFLELLKEFERAESIYLSNKKEKASQTGRIQFDFGNTLSNNKVIQLLKKSEVYETQILRNNIKWEGDFDEVIRWYKDFIHPNEEYQAYLKNSQINFEEDKSILLKIAKQVVFKSEVIDDYFSERIMNWAEDRDILKSLITKSIKEVSEKDSEFKLAELSYNLEDDLAFFGDIFDKTIEKETEIDKFIVEKSKNWEMDRFAVLDHIILRMAITEMLYFPSIPVKVTINEYIEISKKYSTPKSKQFINGILDVLSKDLKSKGLLKKSGRGLLDNK